MKLTREEALKYHRQMWTDMQTALGDKPRLEERILFKAKWCKDHFIYERISSNCFLCEYVVQSNESCDYCPIKWNEDYEQDCCEGTGTNYQDSPISEILALPEREAEDE